MTRKKTAKRKEELYDLLDLRNKLLTHFAENVDATVFKLNNHNAQPQLVIASTTGQTLFLVTEISGSCVTEQKRQQIQQAYKDHLAAQAHV